MVVLTSVTASADLSPEVIRRVVIAHSEQLRACAPGIKGTIRAAWSIDTSGKVVNPRIVSSTMGNAAVEQCVVSAVATWQFPSGFTANVAGYPFNFGTI